MFHNYVCRWIGSIPDCYLLHAPFRESKFLLFALNVRLNVSNDSDVEDFEEALFLDELDDLYEAPEGRDALCQYAFVVEPTDISVNQDVLYDEPEDGPL